MIISPGSTIGVLGSGQLGRMFAIAAHQLGYRVHVYSPDALTPAGQAADLEITASYSDEDALRAFARHVDVVTIEFENIPLRAVEVIEECVPVRPGRTVLASAQNRITEKTMLRNAGLPVPEFATVGGQSDIAEFIQLGAGSRKVVLKSTEAGYDGKGQTIVNGLVDAAAGWARIGHGSAIVEDLVDFEFELSVVGARSVTGEFECFGPILNYHRDHILDVSIAPADCVPSKIRAEAIQMTRTILESLNVIGVLCVEFFYTKDGRLLINEIAPRPHNSGHLSIEAAETSQFEQQVRAVCGLPLGSMRQYAPAAMANLLGEHFGDVEPDWLALLEWPTVKLHLYGKNALRRERKMGHLTAVAASAAIAESHVRSARLVMALGSDLDSHVENTLHMEHDACSCEENGNVN